MSNDKSKGNIDMWRSHDGCLRYLRSRSLQPCQEFGGLFAGPEQLVVTGETGDSARC